MQEPEKGTDKNPTEQSEAKHPEITEKRTIDLRTISFEVDRLYGMSHSSPTTDGCTQNPDAKISREMPVESHKCRILWINQIHHLKINASPRP